MFDIDKLIEALITRFLSLADTGNQAQFVTVRLAIDELLPAFPSPGVDHFYWARADQDYSVIGLGRLFYQTAKGPQRFQILQQGYRDYCLKWQDMPFAFTAFAFDAEEVMIDEWQTFANALVCVPRVLVETENQKTNISVHLQKTTDLGLQKNEIKRLLQQWLKSSERTMAVPVVPAAEIDDSAARGDWLVLANKGITAIRRKAFRKLVVSRKQVLEKSPSFDSTALLSDLLQRYPGCTIVSYRHEGKQFIAATPERLLSLQSGALQSEAIGGTLSEKEIAECSYLLNKQSRLAEKLLLEHAIIVEDICTRLQPVCYTLSLPTAPQLKKVHRIYHLETPISGRLETRQSVLSLVDKLHPTPAIAGFPRMESIAWLRDNENYGRGWYAGAFGWMKGDQTGEVSVLLRCALIEQKQIMIYAGAGLVAESDADQEWQETKLKMKTILDLL